MKTKKKSGKTLRKSGKSQGKIREFDGIKEVGTLSEDFMVLNLAQSWVKFFNYYQHLCHGSLHVM